jgi:hypothetical protein
MARKNRSEGKEVFLTSELESGVEYKLAGWDKRGRAQWMIASPLPSMTMVGGAEAAHRDFRRKGINVQDRITKPLPGKVNLREPRKGGWVLNGKGS